jgi:hypothetical protein
MYEWFEPYFDEWTHYVPMRFDLSDLVEKIQWSAPPLCTRDDLTLARPREKAPRASNYSYPALTQAD